LHQLGTRLLCLDDKAAARPLLHEALAIREALGDRAGAAVTRHNLGLLGAPSSEPSSGKAPRSALRLLPWIGGAVLILVLGGIGLRLFWSGKTDHQGDTVVPVASDLESPAEETDLTETTPLATTDQPHDERRDFEVPLSVNFPTLELGSTSGPRAETISITNTGTVPLRVAGVSFTENPGRAFTLKSGCSRSLPPAGPPCYIEVVFQPQKPGRYRAVLAIDTEGLDRRLVEISGAATEPKRAAMTLSPPEGLDFGEVRVGESRRLDVTITSSGNAPLRIGGISTYGQGGDEFTIDKICRGRTLDPKETCVFPITFKPAVPERRSLLLTVAEFFTGNQGTLVVSGTALPVSVQGWCCAAERVFQAAETVCQKRQGKFFRRQAEAELACKPQMDLSPPSGLDFGEVQVGDSRRLTVTVASSGKTPLRIDAVSLQGEGAEELTIGEVCNGRILAPGETCAFPVTFKPAAPGRRGLRLTVADRTAGIEQTLPLRATAFAAPVQGWCCAEGKVLPGTQAECAERKGTFSEKKSRAELACVAAKTGCCVNGTFEAGVAAEECKRREGVAMTAVEALFRCRKPRESPPPQPEKGFCCIQSTILDGMTEANCAQRGGTFYKTRKEADQRCTVPIR
jgi:hypothetical protein